MKMPDRKKWLVEWMKEKKYFATSDIIRWGSMNGYNRADRTKRNLQEAGLIRALKPYEIVSFSPQHLHADGTFPKQNVYVWIGTKKVKVRNTQDVINFTEGT